jgi:hypothetical protein
MVMSKMIGEVGDVVELTMTLEEARWIGKDRPVIANMFKTSDGDIISIVSTKKIIKAIAIGEQVRIKGTVKAHRVIDKEFVTQLEKPIVTAANLNGRGGAVLI